MIPIVVGCVATALMIGAWAGQPLIKYEAITSAEVTSNQPKKQPKITKTKQTETKTA